MRLGRTPTTGPRHPFRAPLGYAPGKLSLGYQPVEILGISPWCQQPVSKHKTTVSSLRDSEPLFRQPARVVCVWVPHCLAPRSPAHLARCRASREDTVLDGSTYARQNL